MAKPQTITQKILAAHCGKDYVEPGELILAKVDIALGNDITAPMAIKEFRESGAKKVFDRERVVLVATISPPTRTSLRPSSARSCGISPTSRAWSIFTRAGTWGWSMRCCRRQGIVAPGDLIIGADSHTCTYGALGAFATGVGSTDLAAAMVTGECWFKVPESARFTYTGTCPPGSPART